MAVWNVFDTEILEEVVGKGKEDKSALELARERKCSVSDFVRKKASKKHYQERVRGG